jgi:CubicO group peptidase (beta-lactamase class C family)
MLSALAFTLILSCGQTPPPDAGKTPPKPPAEFTAAGVEGFVRDTAKARGFVGLQVVVVREGKPSVAVGVGSTAQQDGRPVTPDTPFAIGSVSKQFTCAALLLLAQEGKLSPTDTVARWYPKLTNAGKVTLLDLMNHTSGYPDYYPLDFVDRRMARPISPDDLIQKYAGGKVDFEPGTKYSYSNTGYTLLGRVVERVSGKPLGEFLRERIFAPLGMRSATFEPPEQGAALARGYRALGIAETEFAPPEGEGWLNGAGGIWCSSNDLARWALALMDGKVLDAKHLEVKTRPRILNNGKKSYYGSGLSVRELNGEAVWGHTGAVSGFHANLTMMPRTRSVVVTLANAEHLDDGKLHREIVALVQKEPASLPKVEGPKAVDHAKELVARLAKGELPVDKIGEEYRLYMTPERLKAYSRTLAALGEPKSVEATSQYERGGMEVSMLRLVFKDGTALLGSLYRLPDGTVEQFLLTKE